MAPAGLARCLIALGGNLGDREANLRRALSRLERIPGIANLTASAFLETRPAGGPADQPAFLNAAATFACQLSPLQVARELHNIESVMGRTREERWGARNIDLDLLLYNDFVCWTRELELPHPRMTVRKFVLQPAVEVAADWIHPGSGWTMSQHLAHLQDTPCRIALAGGSAAPRQQLASAAQARLQELRPAANWQVANDWPPAHDMESTDTARKPRIVVILQAAAGQAPDENDAEIAAESDLSPANAQDDFAAALVRIPGGGILRTDATQPPPQVIDEIVAAALATE